MTLVDLARAHGWTVVTDREQSLLIDAQHERTVVVHLPLGRVVSRERDAAHHNKLARRPKPSVALRGVLDDDAIAAVIRREVTWWR